MSELFFGNDAAKVILKKAAGSQDHHHAYLLYGEDGLGKKTLARLFAEAFLCTGEDKPCGRCPACKKMEHGTHPDFQMIVGEKKNSIHIDSVRKIRQDCVVKPNDGSVKVYLIANIQDMTEEAFNAFLKTLEEAPLHTVFLLTAANLDLLPETIVSRVFPVPVYPLPDRLLCRALKERLPKLSDDEAERAAELAGGNLGKAIACVQSEEFTQRSGLLEQFVKALYAKREYDMLKVLAVYEKDREQQRQFLGEIVSLLRRALLAKTGGAVYSGKGLPFGPQRLVKLIALTEEVRGKLSTNANAGILSAYYCAEIWQMIG